MPVKATARRHAPTFICERRKAPCDYVAIVRIEGQTPYFTPLIVEHSPDGFNFSYNGSGPADLALNILHRCLPPKCDGCPPLTCYRGQTSEIAYQLHQAFKRELIATLPENGGKIEGVVIDDWIDEALQELEDEGYFAGEGAPLKPSYVVLG